MSVASRKGLLAILLVTTLLSGCLSLSIPPLDLDAASSMTPDQAKAQISSILGSYKISEQNPAGWKEWPYRPFILMPPFCGEVMGYDRKRPVSFSELEFAYAEAEQRFVVGRTDGVPFNCTDNPMGVIWWQPLSKAQASRMANSLLALGAKAKKL